MYDLNVFKTIKYEKGLKKISSFFKALKMAYYRATRGFCYQDTYDLDYFYRSLFIKTLTVFRDNLHGAPYAYFDEKAENETARWEEVLDRIIYCFKMSDEDYEDGLKNEYQEEFKKLLLLEFQENGKKMPDEFKEKFLKAELNLIKKRNEFLCEGFNLLCKHFNDLWD